MKMKKKKRKLPGGNVLILQEITGEANWNYEGNK